jgi:hypothetical protein
MDSEGEKPFTTYEGAIRVIEMNADAGGKTYRNALATAFIYAVLDLADAIRSREAGR